jgi:hypothetical protein
MDENSSALPEPKTGDAHLLIAGNVPVSIPFKAYGSFFQSFLFAFVNIGDNSNAGCLILRGVFAFFASVLVPTGGGVVHRYGNCTKSCRSRLAGDGGGSGNEDVDRAGLIASKPAPTGSCGGHRVCERLKIL